jgi:hypothetical protein
MKEEGERKSFRIWIYLIPVYVLTAIPVIKWAIKAHSGNLNLSKETYTAFNSEEGEILETRIPEEGAPELNDEVLGVQYGANSSQAEEKGRTVRQTAAPKRGAAPPARNTGRGGLAGSGGGGMDQMKAREQQSVGFTKGFLTIAVGKTIHNPKAVGAIFNNKLVVGGFMSRGTVKAATGSTQGLANFLKNGSAAANFINNPVVKAAMSNPAVISAIASSGLIKAMIETPAIQGLMNNPQALNDIISTNPQLMATLMANPNIMNALMSNPETAGLLGQIKK